MSRIFDNTIMTTVSYWASFIKNTDLKKSFSNILENRLRKLFLTIDTYNVGLNLIGIGYPEYLKEVINESGANIEDFPKGYVVTVTKFNKVELYFRSDKPIVLYEEEVKDIERDNFLAGLQFRKADGKPLGDLVVLKGIFEDNSFKNGGYLCSVDSAPSNENIDNVYVLAIKYSGLPVAYASLAFGVHPDMKDSTLLLNSSFKESLIYIKQCAVAKGYQSKGVGELLYRRLFNEFPECDFYAHSSVCNIPSQKLHYRAGFRKVGIYKCEDFHGMKNYISDLMYKERSMPTYKVV